MDKMQTMVSKRGQTVVPSVLRRKHKIEAGDRLVWIDDGETIKVVPVSGDSVLALKGIARGEDLREDLLKWRREERSRET
jgi:bifunctional DNA-binding transcriptional regulator/antitoxin component of YhaV-PrlF toxin-antitoxin module